MSYLDTFASNWSDRARKLSQYGVPVDSIFPILQQDLQQVKKGYSPINDNEAVQQVLNRVTGKSFSGEKKRSTGLWGTIGNIPRSIADVVTSIPKLPGTILSEAKTLAPVVPKMLPFVQQYYAARGLADVASKGPREGFLAHVERLGLDVPKEQYQGLSNVEAASKAAQELPGIRFLPGSYTVPSLLTSEGRKELQRNPVPAALDVLPYVSKLGRVGAASKVKVPTGLTPKAAETARLQTVIRSGSPLRARQAAQEAFPSTPLNPNPPLQALAAGRPIRALSRLGVGENQLGVPRSLSNFLSDKAGQVGMSRLNRELSRPEQVYIREEIDKPVREYVRETEKVYRDAGLKTQEDRSIVHTIGINRTIDRANETPQITSLLDRFNEENAALVNRPNSNSFFDLEGEARSKIAGDDAIIWKEVGKPLAKVETLLSKVGMRQSKANANLAMARYPSERNRAIRGVQHHARRKENLLAKQAELLAKHDELSTALPPARFYDKIRENVMSDLREWVKANLSPDDAAKQLQRIDAGLIPLIASNKDEAAVRGVIPNRVVNDIVNRRKAEWKQMKEAGADPVYFPEVTPERAENLTHSAFLVTKTHTPSFEKGRTLLNQLPTVKDPLYLGAAQVKELGKERASVLFEEKTLREPGYIKTAPEVDDLLANQTASFIAAHPEAPPHIIQQFERKLRDEQWMDYNPEEYGIRGATRSGQEKIRRDVGEALKKQTYSEPKFPGVMKVLGKGQSTFKTAALLSTTYPTNNLLGNLSMVAFEVPEAFRNVPKAWSAAFNNFWKGAKGQPSSKVAYGMPHGLSNLDLDRQQAFKFNTGSKLGGLWSRIRESKVGRVARVAEDRWWDLNARMDDFSRNLVYFDELAKRGGDVDAAIRRAGEVINDLDYLTPLERSVIKQIIPFYSFQRHLMKYALRYPADHPIRTVILTRLINQNLEEEDLPERFRSMFWLGSPDSKGEQWRIDTRALNPFIDLGDNFTLAGFMNNASPFISGPLQIMGLNPITGAPGYTDRTYNPESGRFESTRQSDWLTLLKEFIPQYERLDRKLHPHGRYVPTREAGPFSAIKSAVGIPGAGVTNVHREQFLDEGARQRFVSEAIQKATRNKDYSDLDRIPGMVFFRGVPMPAHLAARIIRAINNAVEGAGWEGAPSAIIPPRR